MQIHLYLPYSMPHQPPLILLVDDDPQMLDLFAMKLRANNLAIITAFNGKEGYELAREKLPDLVVLDLRMPVMNGLETLKKLREDPLTKNLKVVFFSSYNEEDGIKMDSLTAQNLGAIDFIPKYASLEEIVHYIQTLLKCDI